MKNAWFPSLHVFPILIIHNPTRTCKWQVDVRSDVLWRAKKTIDCRSLRGSNGASYCWSADTSTGPLDTRIIRLNRRTGTSFVVVSLCRVAPDWSEENGNKIVIYFMFFSWENDREDGMKMRMNTYFMKYLKSKLITLIRTCSLFQQSCKGLPWTLEKLKSRV